MQRYKNANLQAGRLQTGSGTASLSRATSNAYQDLEMRLSRFSSDLNQMGKVQASDEAVKQASRDSIDGKPYHSESIYTTYGKAYNNTIDASYTANAELDLNNKASTFAEQFRNDPIGYKKAFEKYTSTIQEQAPNDNIASVIAITGKKLSNHYFGKLSIAKDRAIREKQATDYMASSSITTGQIINAMADGDIQTADLLKSKWEAYSKTLMDDGIISEAGYTKIKAEARYQVIKGVSEKNLENTLEAGNFDDAKKQIDDFAEKIPEGMTYKEHEAIKASLNRLYGQELRKQQTTEKTVDKLALYDVNENIKILKDGGVPENLRVTDEYVANSNNPVLQKKYEVAKQVGSILSQYSSKTIKEQEQALLHYKNQAKDTTNPIKQAVIDGLESSLSKTKRKAENNLIGLAQDNGIPVVPLNFNDLSGLPERIAQAKTLAEDNGVDIMVLSDTEATTAASIMNDANTPIEDKLSLVSRIVENAGENADLIFQQLSKNGAYTFGFAGEMVQNSNVDAAKYALRGKNADVKIETDFKRDLEEELIGIFSNATYNNIVKSGIIDYVKGYKLYGNEEPSAEEAITATLGKIETYNGRKTILPYKMDTDEFEQILDEYKIPDRPKLQKQINDLTDWSVWSGNTQLHYVGNGKYRVWHPNDGKGYYELDEDENGNTDYFILDVLK